MIKNGKCNVTKECRLAELAQKDGGQATQSQSRRFEAVSGFPS